MALGAIAARSVSPADRYETLDIHAGRVLQIVPRRSAEVGVINGGVYRLKRDAFSDISGARSLERDLLPQLCRTGHLSATVFDGRFVDIGVPESLSAAENIVG